MAGKLEGGEDEDGGRCELGSGGESALSEAGAGFAEPVMRPKLTLGLESPLRGEDGDEEL